MKRLALDKALVFALGLAGGLALFLWWGGSNGRALKERLPGEDRMAGDAGGGAGPAKWDGRLIKGEGAPASLTGTWPQFRGPDRTGISPETHPLARAWGETGPKVLWKTEVGEGFAAPAIWKGRVFVMDYDHKGQSDALRCLSLDDGKEIWRYTYSAKVKRNHGMSRTIPFVNDKFVIALGPKCQIICVDPLSGELKWRLDMVEEFNTEIPPWYAGQCPLVEGDRLILGTGGNALVAAVDCLTGKVLWKSPNPRGWQMTHSSVTPIEVKGRRMYVYCGSGGVAGVSAADGAYLWDTPDWKISIANVPSPVPVGDGRVFLCGGYNAGSLMLQVKESEGKFAVETLFRLKPTVFGATQQTPILYQDHLFGVRPDGQLICLDLAGKPVWESGVTHRFGSGPFLMNQDLLFVLHEEGLLTLTEASTTGYKQLAQAKVLAGPDAWGPMALADGRLIVRDILQMVCLDVTGK